MSQYLWDSNRSQCSFLDQNFSVYSTISKSRNSKYFARKPIETHSGNTITTKRKLRQMTEFMGFYSPMHKSDATTQRAIVEKALPRISEDKNKIPKAEQLSQTNSQLEIVPNIKQCCNNDSKKSFRKKKVSIEDSLLTTLISKQNSVSSYGVLQPLETQNYSLKLQVGLLKQQNDSLKLRLREIIDNQELIKRIELLEKQLQSAECYSKQLEEEIQKVKDHQYQNSKTLDSIYQDSIQSLTRINRSLKQEVYDLNERLKYAGIELTTLRRTEYKDKNLVRLEQDKNRLQKQNRDLKFQIVKLKHLKQMEQISWDLSKSNSEKCVHQ